MQRGVQRLKHKTLNRILSTPSITQGETPKEHHSAMASTSDTNEEYLSSEFDPNRLNVPTLRKILVLHNVSYPAAALKPQLVEIFTAARSRKDIAPRSETKPSSRGITNAPSSQEGTVDGDEDNDASSMPPPPVPDTSRRRSRKSGRDAIEGTSADSPANGRLASGKRSSGKHARPSDTETDPELENKRPLVRKSRKSKIIPSVKVEESVDFPVRPSLGESAFSHENPFQSGSSPLTLNESRRRSGGTSGERRKSTSRRRRTEGVGSVEPSGIKQEDGVVVPSAKTFEVPVARIRRSKVKDEQDDGVEAGEDFTPEEQLELVRERAANGERDILPPRKKKRSNKSSSIPKSAPWLVFMTLLSGYALWWRQEKLEVGYCGIGKTSKLLANVQLSEWVGGLQPECEACPQHAICYERLETKCEQDFVLKPHPLSLGGLVPLSPTCEPDGEKVRRVKVVADRAIEELRERKAKWECGTLVDDQGKTLPVELDETALKGTVGQKRRRGMGEAEFEDLWRGALGEITGRDEVVHSTQGHDSHLLATTSLARLPVTCAVRRSLRLTLARYRIQLVALITLLTLLAYVRLEIRTRRASRARVPALVAMALDRLATQAALHARGDAAEEWISVGQLRDDVLRDEFSAQRREGIWRKVKEVVETNANVRTSVREGRGGEISRVWEWIGSVGILGGDENWSSGSRRTSSRVSFGGRDERLVENGRASPAPKGGEMVEQRKWDEGRPIY